MVWDQPVNNEVVVEILQTSEQLKNDALNLERNKTEKTLMEQLVASTSTLHEYGGPVKSKTSIYTLTCRHKKRIVITLGRNELAGMYEFDLPAPLRMVSACSPADWPDLVHSNSSPERGWKDPKRFRKFILDSKSIQFNFIYTAPNHNHSWIRQLRSQIWGNKQWG